MIYATVEAPKPPPGMSTLSCSLKGGERGSGERIFPRYCCDHEVSGNVLSGDEFLELATKEKPAEAGAEDWRR